MALLNNQLIYRALLERFKAGNLTKSPQPTGTGFLSNFLQASPLLNQDIPDQEKGLAIQDYFRKTIFNR